MNVGERQRQVRIIGIQRKSRGYGNDLDPQLTKRLQVEKLCAWRNDIPTHGLEVEKLKTKKQLKQTIVGLHPKCVDVMG